MIRTTRLELVVCERKHLEAYARGKAELGTVLDVTMPIKWPHFPEAFTLPNEDTAMPPTDWPGFLFINAQAKTLVGNGGFATPPDARGTVEIGYEIADEFWNQGFATEAAQGMLDYAFSHPEVTAIIAHTLGVQNASNSVLKKLGMRYVNELTDPEIGKIWQWRITREEYSSSPTHG